MCMMSEIVMQQCYGYHWQDGVRKMIAIGYGFIKQLVVCSLVLVVNMNRPYISHGRRDIELQRFRGYEFYKLDLLWSRDVIYHVTIGLWGFL